MSIDLLPGSLGYTSCMRSLGYTGLSIAQAESKAATELELLGSPPAGETTPLRKGDRVYIITVEGEFPGTVVEDWETSPTIDDVTIVLDDSPSVELWIHRSLFRAFTVLDHLASC